MNSGRKINFAQHLDLTKFELNKRIKHIVKANNHDYIDLIDYTCKSTKECLVKTTNGDLMQFDYGHLTLSATLDIVEAYAPIFSTMVVNENYSKWPVFLNNAMALMRIRIMSKQQRSHNGKTY